MNMTSNKALKYNSGLRQFIIYTIVIVILHFIFFHDNLPRDQVLIGLGELLIFVILTGRFVKSIQFTDKKVNIKFIWFNMSKTIDYSEIREIKFKPSRGYSLDYSTARLFLNPDVPGRNIEFAISEDEFYELSKHLDEESVKCTTPNKP